MKKFLSLLMCIVLLAGTVSPISSAETFNEEESCDYGIVAGDANDDGRTNLKDVTVIIRKLAGYNEKVSSRLSDVNLDDKISIKDVALIIQFLAGWREVRLGHADVKEVIAEATEEEFGCVSLTCSLCGSSKKVLRPLVGQEGTFEIKGVPLSEYTIVYGNCPGKQDLLPLANEFRAALQNITGIMLRVKTADSEVNEHEIVIGDAERDVLPEFEENVPAAGVCEDGTVYFYGYSLDTIRYLIDSFISDHFNTPYYTSFGATLGRTGVLSNPWGSKNCDEWSCTVDTLDLEAEGYTLVFEDEFEGTELNMDNWKHRATGERRNGVNDPAMVVVEDGTLKIKGEYVVGGTYGDKWHAGMIALNENYSQGYFEISAKCADSSYGFWSAFWIQGSSPYTADQSQGGIGPGGAELDILENNCAEGYTRHNVYCAGVSDVADTPDYSAYNSGEYFIGDIENEYHTYALKWDEEWYTFYVDGIVVGRTNYGDGTSVAPEQVILSLEIGADMPSPEDADFETLKDTKTEYVVDYIRIYQK